MVQHAPLPHDCSAPSQSDWLQLQGLQVKRGGHVVLQALNWPIAAQARIGLLGANGSGKSTLLNVLSGLTPHQKGRIIWQGHTVLQAQTQARRIAQMRALGLRRGFQHSHCFARLSIAEHVRLLQAPHSHDLLQRLGLDIHHPAPARDLPYSQQRLLDLLLALAEDFQLLLLDEPTAGLSGDACARAVATIAHYCQGKALILVEHDSAVQQALCTSRVQLTRLMRPQTASPALPASPQDSP